MLFLSIFSRARLSKVLDASLPNVHRYASVQRREATEHIYQRYSQRIFARRKTLFNDQDHVIIRRGLRSNCLGTATERSYG